VTSLGPGWDYGQGKTRKQESDDSVKALGIMVLAIIVEVPLIVAVVLYLLL
jgi:hypothetical protein